VRLQRTLGQRQQHVRRRAHVLFSKKLLDVVVAALIVEGDEIRFFPSREERLASCGWLW
jgi:hypothetical protein